MRPKAVGPDGSDAAVRCGGLTKRYGELVAVDRLDLVVHQGECFGLLGPNGAGKTTTIEVLEGLIEPDAGTVEVLGMIWARDTARLRQRIGVQLQETRLPPKLKVGEVVRLFRSFYEEGPDPEQVLAIVQLQEKRDTWVSRLSGGQRQRLAVACALTGTPDLLFLDEPTTGLDPQSRRSLWDVIETFRARGKSVLLTTHYMEEATRLCDRVGIMDRGRVIAVGTPAELIAALGAEHVVEFALPTAVPQLTPRLRALPGVMDVQPRSGGYALTVGEVHRVVPELLALLRASGLELASLGTHHATLEDVFVTLTGRQLRDE